MPDSRPVLRLGHSPDPDDAFMWWPIVEIDGTPSRMDTGRFRFQAVLDDIEKLNRRSSSSSTADLLEVTAISCAQYPHVKDRYALTACGSSMGDNYGPKLVARKRMSLDELKQGDIVLAVPGERTSAFAVTSLMLGVGRFRFQVVPFDQIIPRMVAGEFTAGLIIHEGQLTFESAGLHLIEDVGSWWTRRRKLPLPLGANAIRRDLDHLYGPGALREITTILRRSVEYALAHREQAIGFSLNFAREMDAALADRFVGMYVNKWSLDFGDVGREAVRAFLHEMHDAGLAPNPDPIDFVEPWLLTA